MAKRQQETSGAVAPPAHNLRKSTTRKRESCVVGGVAYTSIFYKIPIEVRKMIFKIIVDDFFEEYPDRKELDYPRPRRALKSSKIVAGLPKTELPDLEKAFSIDIQLLIEFTRTRFEGSVITLIPGFADLNLAGEHIAWPSIQTVKPQIRKSVPVVIYELYMGFELNSQYTPNWITTEKDILGQMEKVGLAINELLHEQTTLTSDTTPSTIPAPTTLLPVTLLAPACPTTAPPTATHPTTNAPTATPPLTTITIPPKLHTPKLQTLVIRFPETLEYYRRTARDFSTNRLALYTNLATFFNKGDVKAFEFQDTSGLARAPANTGTEAGAANKSSNFGAFTADLDAIFGIRGEENSGGESFEAVNVIWKAKGKSLVWDRDAEEELKKGGEKVEEA